MITTPMEFSTCDRCKASVFQCHVGGIRAITDVVPIDRADIRGRLLMGRTVYRVVPGRKLARFGRDATNAVGERYMVDHWCGPGVVGAQKVPLEPPGPPSAPVTSSEGSSPPDVPESGSQGRTAIFGRPTGKGSSKLPQRPALNATSRHIKPTRCNICRGVIAADTPDTWSIEHDGRLVYAEHVRC